MTSFSLNILERTILLIISIREGIKQTFLHSDIDMGNNKIINLGNFGSANDAV